MKENTENEIFKGLYMVNDLSELDYIPGKSNNDGEIEYSQTKRWDKTVSQTEDDIASRYQVLILLDRIDQSLDKIYTLLHKEVSSSNTSIPWWKKVLKWFFLTPSSKKPDEKI